MAGNLLLLPHHYITCKIYRISTCQRPKYSSGMPSCFWMFCLVSKYLHWSSTYFTGIKLYYPFRSKKILSVHCYRFTCRLLRSSYYFNENEPILHRFRWFYHSISVDRISKKISTSNLIKPKVAFSHRSDNISSHFLFRHFIPKI